MAAKEANDESQGYLLTEDEQEEVIKAVEDGDCAPLQKFIENKWNINQPLDRYGGTALHIAAERGRTEVVRVLVQGGADVDVQDRGGRTPLYRAAEGGDTDIVKVMLANKASVDVRDGEGWTPLHWAAWRGHTDTVKVLLANKASVDERNMVGRTPLYWAAVGGHTDTVKVMLANKASVDVRDDGGWTPLHMAARLGHADTVKVLLANKASVDVRNRLGNTPLHVAAEYGRTEVVKLLCRESGCDVNTVNENGNTPLHRACEYGHLDVVKLLIEEDGDVTVVNKNGETAYDVCGRGRYVDESTVENIKGFLKEHLLRVKPDAPPTGKRRETEKLHQQVLLEVAERVIGGDFEKLKELCGDWIKPAILQNITNTQELLEQLQRQAIINVGDYSELTRMLHQLHLEELKDQMEKLSREIKAAGMRDVLLSPDDKANGIIRVEQPLLMQAVREEFEDGTVYLHPQRVCLQTGVPAFTVPVTMKVDVSDILTQLGDDKDPSRFFILRLSNGEVTDITTQCNAQLHGQELVYYCRHFSEHVIGWTEYLSKVFSFIRDYLKGTFRAKLCPSAKKEKFGVSLSLLCHEDGANCPEHPCETEYPSELHCQQEIMFLAQIKCTREDVEKRSDPMKVDREICKQTGMRIDEWQSVEDRELGDVVVMKVYQLSKENKAVLLRSRKVQIQKDTTTESPSTPACLPSKLQVHQQANRIEQPLLKQDDREEFRVGVAMSQIGQVQFARSNQKDTTAESPSTCAYPSEEQRIRRGPRELHQQLLLKVADSVIDPDFKRLKGLCKAWIEPAILQNITNTQELLEQLQRQEIINVGDYSELTRMLHQLHLEELAELVEKLSSEIKGLGLQREAEGSLQFPLGKVAEKEVSVPKARAPKTHYEVDIFQKHDDLSEKPVNRPRSPVDERENAIINGTTGGVIRWKEVEFRVPSNAVCGHIHVEIVDQPLLVQAVIDNTNGRATLHRQRICVTCADEDVMFSEPVEVRVTVRTMLEGLYLQQLDREGFRILREKNGEVTDVSEECNVRVHGDEIFFCCKTFSILHTAWVGAAKLLRPLKNIIFTSYTCKLCPYIEGEPHGGLTIMVFCHGIDVTCSGDLQHQCISKNMCLTNKTTLIFEVECLGANSNEMELISHEFELDRDCCESTGTSFGESKPGVKPLVADKVNVKLRVSNYPKPLLDRPEKVHVHEVSAVGTALATHTASNTTEARRDRAELHHQLLLEVADGIIDPDFERLKTFCGVWIAPAILQNITNARELLNQLERQAVIAVGDYSKLIDMLDLLNLNGIKRRVEELARDISALGV